MKKIIYNDDHLQEEDINNVVKRAKAIIINSSDEILLTLSHNNYFLIGGHVENEESDIECLEREILEETGIKISIGNLKPYLSIIYYSKEYPSKELNSKYIINFYEIKTDLKPNLDILNLTDDEIEGNFELKYINKNKILEELNNNLKVCSRINVVRDTIEAVKSYFEN